MLQQARGVVLGVAIGLASVGCGPTSVKTEHVNGETVDADEQRLINESRKFLDELERTGYLMREGRVTDYVRAVGARVLAARSGRELTIHVMRSPVVNAMALPDGTVLVTLGLLSRLQNEAQLAFVLAHEAVHVDQRHGVASAKSRRAGLVAAGVFDVLLGGTSIAYLPYISSAASFSRDQELESDSHALPLLAQAGYDVNIAKDVFDVLEEVREGDALTGSAYASHPSNQERAERMQVLLGEMSLASKSSDIGQDRYLAVRDEVLEQDVRLKLNVKRYQLALEAVERAARRDAQTPLWSYYRGEVFRRMAEDPRSAAEEEARLRGQTYDDSLLKTMEAKHLAHFQLAKQHYEKALTADKAFARAYRGLGLVYAKEGEASQALAMLRQYLAMAPDARDARYIKHIIKKTESQ